MKALAANHYGSPDTLRISEWPKPVPNPNEVLVNVLVTTVNRTDTATLRAHPFFARAITGLVRPKFDAYGMEFAGRVEAIGRDVTRFVVGDAVFGLSPDRFGAHAEFLSVAETGAIARKPDTIPFPEAVVCEGAWYANGSVGGVGPGDDVLIYGASGAIGIAATQISKIRGAHVTAVVGPQHIALVRSLGADRVIDYTREDFTRIGLTFDVVFDAVGKTSYFSCRDLLKPKGVFRASDMGPGWSNIWLGLWSGLTGSRRVAVPFPEDAQGFVQVMAGWLENGSYRGVFDRIYPFSEIAEAYRYVEGGQKTGVVVIDMAADANGRQIFDANQAAN